MTLQLKFPWCFIMYLRIFNLHSTIRNPFKYTSIALFTLYLFTNLFFLKKILKMRYQRNKKNIDESMILARCPKIQHWFFFLIIFRAKADNVIPIYSSSSFVYLRDYWLLLQPGEQPWHRGRKRSSVILCRGLFQAMKL